MQGPRMSMYRDSESVYAEAKSVGCWGLEEGGQDSEVTHWMLG